MIRFQIKRPNGDIILTEWHEETLGDLSRQTAAQQVAKLRQEYPDGEISVERTSVIPRKKQQMVRFKISQKNDVTMHSIGIPLQHKDAELARLKEKFPDAKITAKEFEN